MGEKGVLREKRLLCYVLQPFYYTMFVWLFVYGKEIIKIIWGARVIFYHGRQILHKMLVFDVKDKNSFRSPVLRPEYNQGTCTLSIMAKQKNQFQPSAKYSPTFLVANIYRPIIYEQGPFSNNCATAALDL